MQYLAYSLHKGGKMKMLILLLSPFPSKCITRFLKAESKFPIVMKNYALCFKLGNIIKITALHVQ